MGVIREAPLEKEEREKMILLLAMCKLMKIKTDTMSVRSALKDARTEVDLLEQGTNPFGLNPRQ
jgi:hypothetical protein